MEKIRHVEKFLEKQNPQTVQPVLPPTVNTSSRTQTTVSTPSNSAQNVPHPEITSEPDSTSDITESQVQTNTRLPKLSLPNFSGDPLLWQTFWDSFNVAVNNNPSLSKVQKFSYLRAQLQCDAARTIDGFPLTDINYDQSILLLKERFGQPHKLTNVHMQALLNLPPPVNSLPSLLAFIDSVETHIRALSALRVSQESYGTLLAPIITN